MWRKSVEMLIIEKGNLQKAKDTLELQLQAINRWLEEIDAEIAWEEEGGLRK